MMVPRSVHPGLPERAAVLVVAGIALVVVATMVLGDMSAAPRWGVGLLGAALLWHGAGKLARTTLGPEFDLGLWLSAAWIGLLVVVVVLAPLLPFEGPRELPLRTPTYLRPDLFSEHPFGTDGFGRDYLSRLVHGARVSLIVGVGGTAVALVVGTVIGMTAGLFRGRVDALVNVLTDALLAFPPLVFLLALVAVLRPSLSTIFVAFSVLGVPTIVRLARANTFVFAQREFVMAARGMGATNRRIILREILPNLVLPLVSFSMVIVAALILGEASLSFLGLGIAPPDPSWGNMIAESQTVLKEHPHTLLVPSAALFLTVVSFNRLGEAARLRWDARDAAL